MSGIKRQIENESAAFLPCSEDPMSIEEQYESADFEMFQAAVWKEEDRMLIEEGAFCVEGQFFDDAFDAEIERRFRAVEIVNARARKREAVFQLKQNLNGLR